MALSGHSNQFSRQSFRTDLSTDLEDDRCPTGLLLPDIPWNRGVPPRCRAPQGISRSHPVPEPPENQSSISRMQALSHFTLPPSEGLKTLKLSDSNEQSSNISKSVFGTGSSKDRTEGNRNSVFGLSAKTANQTVCDEMEMRNKIFSSNPKTTGESEENWDSDWEENSIVGAVGFAQKTLPQGKEYINFKSGTISSAQFRTAALDKVKSCGNTSSGLSRSGGLSGFHKQQDGIKNKDQDMVKSPEVCVELSRLSPESSKPDLMEIFKASGKKGIFGKRLLTIGMMDNESNPWETLSKPIGCTRDEESGRWIICDTDHAMVKIFTWDGISESLIAPYSDEKVSFKHPAAAVILNRGKFAEQSKSMPCFAVKDDVCIQIFRIDGGDFVRKFGDGIMKSPRGLAMDEDGNLITLNYAIHGGDGTELIVFDPTNGNIVKREPYGPLSSYHSISNFGACGGKQKGPQPRFMDCYEDVLAVSDLGLDLVFLTSNKNGNEIKKFGQKGRLPGSFNFVSGISFDGAGNMLIGDAKNNRVQLFDKNALFVSLVDFDIPTPFVSDIHLTSTGLLMVMCRYKHVVHIFKLHSSKI